MSSSLFINRGGASFSSFLFSVLNGTARRSSRCHYRGFIDTRATILIQWRLATNDLDSREREKKWKQKRDQINFFTAVICPCPRLTVESIMPFSLNRWRTFAEQLFQLNPSQVSSSDPHRWNVVFLFFFSIRCRNADCRETESPLCIQISDERSVKFQFTARTTLGKRIFPLETFLHCLRTDSLSRIHGKEILPNLFLSQSKRSVADHRSDCPQIYRHRCFPNLSVVQRNDQHSNTVGAVLRAWVYAWHWCRSG